MGQGSRLQEEIRREMADRGRKADLNWILQYISNSQPKNHGRLLKWSVRPQVMAFLLPLLLDLMPQPRQIRSYFQSRLNAYLVHEAFQPYAAGIYWTSLETR